MKFPYGVSDFGKITDDDLFYQDRTHLIPFVEGLRTPRELGISL